jgi:hypothetical protein
VNISEKRIWIFGVANACPLNSPLDTCPFKDIREKTLAERWKYITELSENQIDALITNHKKCLFERELKRTKK